MKEAVKKRIWFDSFIIEDGYIWAFSNDINGLFQYDLKTNTTTFLGSVPGEPILEYALFWNIIKVDRKIILIPARARNLVIYDIDANAFSCVPLDNPNDEYYSAAQYKDKVFFIGCNNAKIAVFSLKKQTIHYIDVCEKYIRQKKTVKDRVVFRRNTTVIDGHLYYLSFCNCSAVAELDMATESVKIFELPAKYEGLRSICHKPNENSFWITDWDGKYIIKWRINEGVVDEIQNPYFDSEGYHTADIIYKDGIWLYPTNEKKVIFYNDETKEWLEVKELSVYLCGDNKHPWKQNFPSTILKGDDFYIFCGHSMSLIKMRADKEIEWEKKMEIDISLIHSCIIREQSMLFENVNINVQDYINAL